VTPTYVIDMPEPGDAPLNFKNAAQKEKKEVPVKTVELSGSVALKILQHCSESDSTGACGQLLGLDVSSTLEVTECFPSLVRRVRLFVLAFDRQSPPQLLRCCLVSPFCPPHVPPQRRKLIQHAFFALYVEQLGCAPAGCGTRGHSKTCGYRQPLPALHSGVDAAH
jgi:hypothetical protein